MSSGGRKRHRPLLFIDRNAWSHALGEALRLASIEFIAHHQHFAPDAADVEWLATAGRERWIVLTRDQNIRRRPLELAAVRTHRVVMFVLSRGNLSAQESAQIVVSAYNRIVRAAQGARRPAIFTLTREGRIQQIRFK
ncbi:MAG: hypothetical protein ACRECQ_12010 [Burkholderiaceae bacterium]